MMRTQSPPCRFRHISTMFAPHVHSLALAALLLAVAHATVLTAPATAEPLVRQIAPGVSHEQISRPDGPWEIGVIRIDRQQQGWQLDIAMGQGQVSGVERLSGIIARESRDEARAVAAVNGDFFQMANRPYPGGTSGVIVRRDELMATPRGRAGFYLMGDGSPRIEAAHTSGSVSVGETVYPLGCINSPHQGVDDQVQLFTAAGGWELSEGCVVVSVEDGPLRTEGGWTGAVLDTVPAGQVRRADGQEVLLTSVGERTRAGLLAAQAGDTVRIELSTEPLTETAVLGLGGGPVLVRGGQTVGGDNQRHPRTAVGFSDEQIMLVTVDGRQPGWSVGMTLTELAVLMLELGCTEAMNLDGGGSTTAWVRGEVVNRPSDGAERLIANALLVVSTAPIGAPERIEVQPERIVALSGAQIQLQLRVTDQWYNPVELNLAEVEARVSQQTGEAPISVAFADGRLTMHGGPGQATVELRHPAVAELNGRVQVQVAESCERLEVVPQVLRLLPGGQGRLQARGLTEDGSTIALPPGAPAWTLEGRGIRHLGDGVFEAMEAGAQVQATAGVGESRATAAIKSAEEVPVEDFAAGFQPRFHALPGSVAGRIELVRDGAAPEPAAFCRLEYDLGEAAQTRAAYMMLDRRLGDALAVSFMARATGEQAPWVRVQVADGKGETHLLTAARLLAPADGWQRLTVRLPADFAPPAVWRSVYVVATAPGPSAGSLDIADLRAMVVAD